MEERSAILIVEDDARLAASVQRGLREEGYSTEVAASSAAARHSLSEKTFDLIILDVGLPDGDGLRLLSEWRSKEERTPVLITTARGELEDKVAGFRSGADDYLVKPFAFAELLARMQARLRRADSARPTAYKAADLSLDIHTRTATRAGRQIDLTPREIDLLAYLLESKGHVVSREMLAKHVWRTKSSMTCLDNVIDVHISRLRDKIDKGFNVPLIHTVRGVGFVLKEGK